MAAGDAARAGGKEFDLLEERRFVRELAPVTGIAQAQGVGSGCGACGGRAFQFGEHRQSRRLASGEGL
jgi:bacterioferritin-associated ferredoxin